MFAAFGGVLAFPLVSSAHPIQQHLRDAAGVASADQKANAAAYTPEFLDPHQFATLQTLAERIVPGSTQARSSEFIDQLLVVADASDQKAFLQALGAFEGLAIERARQPWKALSPEQQIELLTLAAAEKPGASAEHATASSHPTLRDHFEQLKGWIVGAYYSSEIGMRELGWTGNFFFRTFPGCEHPDGHR
jgi:hypothetical protein